MSSRCNPLKRDKGVVVQFIFLHALCHLNRKLHIYCFENPYNPNKGGDINRCVVDLLATEAESDFPSLVPKEHVPLWRNPRA